MVLPQYQHQGIGNAQRKPGWKIKIVLVAAKGKEGFYQKLGFCSRPNENSGPGMDIWLG